MAYGQDYEESRIFLSYLFIEKSLDTVLAELLINNVLFLELTFEEREIEREAKKETGENSVYTHKQRAARVHPRARPSTESDPRNWILLESIDR